MNVKRFANLINVAPAKRYKSFVTEVCDTENVWLSKTLSGKKSVWAEKCFAENLHNSGELLYMDIHDFVDLLNSMDSECLISVFPTNESNFLVRSEDLLNSIVEELNRIE